MFKSTTYRLRDIMSTNDTKQIGINYHFYLVLSDKITNMYKTTY